MEFDVTNIDKKLLIRALVAYAQPVGYGITEYVVRKFQGENVDGLSDSDCEDMLWSFNKLEHGSVKVIDYFKGQPIKLELYRKRSGQIITPTEAYDKRNGKYKFLEAMLNSFPIDEVLITRKGYREFTFSGLSDQELSKNKIKVKTYKKMIQKSKLYKGKYGKHWIVDKNSKEGFSSILNTIKG